MRITTLSLLVMLPVLVVGVAGPARPDGQLEGDQMIQPNAKEALAGRPWRLVQIMSMDDNTYAPEDRSQYTLTFTADGGVQIRGDCNRGTGSWASSAPGELTFGRIAATRAQCPPGSLH